MNLSTALHSSSFAAENWQHEKPDTDVKTQEGFFRRHLITPIKNATRYIADGIRTLCRRIRSFFVRTCTPLPCCACLRGKERTDSKTGLQEPAPRRKEDSAPEKPENHETEGKPGISSLTSHDVALSNSQLQSTASLKETEKSETPELIFCGSSSSNKQFQNVAAHMDQTRGPVSREGSERSNTPESVFYGSSASDEQLQDITATHEDQTRSAISLADTERSGTPESTFYSGSFDADQFQGAIAREDQTQSTVSLAGTERSGTPESTCYSGSFDTDQFQGAIAREDQTRSTASLADTERSGTPESTFYSGSFDTDQFQGAIAREDQTRSTVSGAGTERSVTPGPVVFYTGPLHNDQLQGAAAREDAEMPETFDLTSHNAAPNSESERFQSIQDKKPNKKRSKPDPDSSDKRHKRSLTRPIRKKISSATKWVKTNFKH